MADLIDRIENVITQKRLSFYKVEKACELGNGTIKRWREQSPRLDKLAVVAQYLNVSLDYLVFGVLQTESSPNREQENLEAIKREQGLSCDGSPLTDEEADLIAMFRLLPSHEQEDIFDLVYFKYKKHVERKAESIYWTYADANTNKKSGPIQSSKAKNGTT